MTWRLALMAVAELLRQRADEDERAGCHAEAVAALRGYADEIEQLSTWRGRPALRRLGDAIDAALVRTIRTKQIVAAPFEVKP